MTAIAAHLFAGHRETDCSRVIPRFTVEPAMAAKHRPVGSAQHPVAAREPCGAGPIKWLLSALLAHHRGFALGSAMRCADREAGASAAAREALDALDAVLGADGRPLPARLRRLVLARLAAALRPRQPRSAIRRAIAARSSAMPKSVRDDVASTSG
jgi:hypothetical protein